MEAKIFSVGELNRHAREVLEAGLPLLWVGGEISNLTRAASGHIYFTLKDATAQVRCVMFRSRAQILPWRLENGQQVEAQVLVTLYEARGDFQLNVEGMRRAGLGRLYEAYARLRDKLADEGLFAPERKRELPLYPRRIGIVTSPQAAALRDILAALRRRAPHLELTLFPTLVQGGEAAAQVAAALARAGASGCDVVILARGGGSIEDLWSFNEEAVARAIVACPLPVVVGVGHETDTTIADFAADVRAATPTAAAELVSAAWFAAGTRLHTLAGRLNAGMRQFVEARMQRLDLLAHRLVSPQQALARQRLQLSHLHTRIGAAQARTMQARRSRCEQLQQALQLLNPQATLQRGYSIVRGANGAIIADSRQIGIAEKLQIRFGAGEAEARVESKKPETK